MEATIQQSSYVFLEGGGEMGSLMRSFDWSKTAIGSPDKWPQSLRTTVSIILHSPFPMFLWWGDDLIQFYNDAYRPSLGNEGKHPKALGQKGKECWPEIWDFLQPNIDLVFKQGGSIKYEDQLVPIFRNGKIEEVYWSFSYSPVINEAGKVEGMLVVCQETTNQVARFRNVVEQAPGPILIFKGENLILEVANQALFNSWKVGPDAIGKSFLEILPEMKGQPFVDQLLDVYHHGLTHYGYEVPALFNRGNGENETIYYNYVYQPYREADGTISGVLILATDVTEKVRASRKAEESEKNFLSLIMQAPVPISIYRGPELIIELANESALQLAGVGKEVIGKPLQQVLPEIEAQGFIQLLRDVMHYKQPYTASETRVVLHKKGKEEVFYVNFTYQPYYEANGEVLGILAVANDVTDQVVARKKIEDAEERARLAINSAELGVFEVNLLTDDIISSPRLNSIFGFDYAAERSELLAAVHPDDLQIRQMAYKKAYISGHLEYDGRVVWKDQSVHWVRVKGKVFYDEAHTPIRLLGVAQDITEQKLFAEELAKQVNERTKELRMANQQLEKSNAELEQFAYVASHDLQEPLRKISVFNSRILDMEPANNEVRNYAEKIAESAKRMSNLIRELLEYSSLSKGRIRLEKVNLNTVLENVLSDFEVMIHQKKAQVHKDNLPVIDAVPLQINQLFFNLIGNALKFSKKETAPVITIKAQPLSDEDKSAFPQLHPHKAYIKLLFQDNGIGFHPSYAEKIFTIFQRLNAQSIYGGYGIGLALCSKIVANHQGIIYAEGQPKAGATFTVVLPCQQ